MLTDASFDPYLLWRTEEAGLNATVVARQRFVDGWLLRLSQGKARRTRCITALFPGRMTLSERLAASQRIYAEARLPMILRLTPFSLPSGLDAELDALQWRRVDETRVMLLEGLPTMAPPGVFQGLSVERVGLEAFARIVGEMRGSTSTQQLAHAERLLQTPVQLEAWVARKQGQVMTCGHIAIDRALVGLYDVFVEPSARGRGMAQQLCRVLLQRAQVLGAEVAYLQVEVDNTPAVATYDRLGFRPAYRYHYRTRAEDAVAPVA